MLLAVADGDRLFGTDVFGHGFCFVERGAVLVEISHLELGAVHNRSRLRLQLAKQGFDQCCLAAAVRADDADLVTAHDVGTQVFDNRDSVVVV